VAKGVRIPARLPRLRMWMQGGHSPRCRRFGGWQRRHGLLSDQAESPPAASGVTPAYLTQWRQLEISGPGGPSLRKAPASPARVDAYIAGLRKTASLGGPDFSHPAPRHLSIEESWPSLITIFTRFTPRPRCPWKLVAGSVIGTIAPVCQGQCRCESSRISGHDGGTGASPLLVRSNTPASPWELGPASECTRSPAGPMVLREIACCYAPMAAQTRAWTC